MDLDASAPYHWAAFQVHGDPSPVPNGRTGNRPLKRIFTEYVRSLDPDGEPPDAERFTELWDALRIALRSELAKRGLLQTPARVARAGPGVREPSLKPWMACLRPWSKPCLPLAAEHGRRTTVARFVHLPR